MRKVWEKYFLNNQKDQRYAIDFSESETNVAIERIKWLNIFMLIFSLYFFYNDYVMKKTFENMVYINHLFKIHVFLATVALVFLVIALITTKISKISVLSKTIIIDVYIALAIVVGMLISLNSAYYTLTITIYTTIGLFVAIFIPLRPKHSITIYALLHLTFIFLLMRLNYDASGIVINQINSTVVIGVSLFLSVIFYYLRKNDFINKKKIIEHQASIDALFEISPFPICIVEMENSKMLKANKRAMAQYRIESSIERPLYIKAFFVYESDYIRFEQELNLHKHLDDYMVAVTNLGTIRWILCNCEMIEYNGIKCVLMALTDITKLKEIEKELTSKASTDYLTNVLNRSKGIELVDELIFKKEDFTLVFCDINGLKMINDVYGHIDGDFAIKLIAHAISHELMSDEELFRFGGDEFVIIIKSTNETLISNRIESIITSIRTMDMKAEKPYSISASFGYAIADMTKNQTADEIVLEADKKMYEKKKLFYQE